MSVLCETFEYFQNTGYLPESAAASKTLDVGDVYVVVTVVELLRGTLRALVQFSEHVLIVVSRAHHTAPTHRYCLLRQLFT